MNASRNRARAFVRYGTGIDLEPATVLPVQLGRHLAPDASIVPEKRLLLAVLEEAVVTLQRYATDSGRRGRRLFREAEEWLRSDDVCWPCSFRNICDALGFDATGLRQGLWRWCDLQRAGGPTLIPHRHAFRRLSGSRTRAIGRPIGLGRRPRGRPPL
jgi:hypothetical protein